MEHREKSSCVFRSTYVYHAIIYDEQPPNKGGIVEAPMKIKEVIVVEGKNDTAKIKQAVEADTIETNGSEISLETLKKIQTAQSRRGVIVFTDPDFPGEKIRETIRANIQGVKHAFLEKEVAKAKGRRGIGIEHASVEAIQRALSVVRTEKISDKEYISWQTLVQHNFVGGERARQRREQLGHLLNIGYMNAKQLYKRLNMFQITLEEFEAALEKMKEVERND